MACLARCLVLHCVFQPHSAGQQVVPLPPPLCRFHYTMLAWLPTYFSDSLSLNLARAAQVGGLLTHACAAACVPPLLALVAA